MGVIVYSHEENMSDFTKKHLIIYQNGDMIFENDVYICLEGKNYCNSNYYFSSNNDIRYIKFSYTADGTQMCKVSLGTTDTFILNEPGKATGFFTSYEQEEND